MREVKPTQKPVPSSDIKDLFFNSGLLDIWATSLERKYIDRFGSCHLTAAGMEWIFNELVEKFKVDMNTAIVAAGYITVDSFQQGADLPNNELTQRNHILRDETTGEYYRWDGDLPKQVPAGSTPQSTGGIGKGAWVSVGDASLRGDIKSSDGASLIGTKSGITVQEEINNKQGKFSLSAIEFGCIADRSTDNTSLIQSLINSVDGQHVYITIEPNILWHFKNISMKNGVNIIDMSGWDDEYSHWNEHIKYHFNHNADNSQHNGNTFHILGRHHPAFVIDNIGNKNDPEADEKRASLVFRQNSRLTSRVGIGIRSGTDSDESDSHFVITDREISARFSFYNNKADDFEMGFNGQPQDNVDFMFTGRSKNTTIRRIRAPDGKGVSEQYLSGLRDICVISYGNDGSIKYDQNGSTTLIISPIGEISGNKKFIIESNNRNLNHNESGSVLLNGPISSTSTYQLPVGGNSKGTYYNVTNVTGSKISVITRQGESFSDGETTKEWPTKGGRATVLYIGGGKWIVY